MQNLEPEAPLPRTNAPTGELVREAVDDARRLIRLEIQLARDDLKRELVALRTSGIVLGASAVAAIVGLSLVLVAIALAVFPGPVPALLIGVLLLAGAGLGASMGFKVLPKKPLDDTRRRLETNIDAVREQVGNGRMT
jgi:hypothetical protein